jgi:ABC-type glycerol-3-phosphate transport system substrate-binding protein
MRRSRMILAILALTLLLAACAAGANPEVGTAAAGGGSAGFWLGLWHGFISPITFLISLFNENVSIYEVHNSGNWYDFGFVLGAGILFGGGFLGARRR